jgi:class 3 adenylate cyclase/predicted ATPase
MFCDLVASTALAERLDVEDLREIMRRYYDACGETIRRYDGYVAQYLGDGVLAYFGFPRAHEDDAERAVRAGLDMLAKLETDFATLNATLEAERGVRLSARIGIHTGAVVVGDLGANGRQETLALGETVNLAARLQGIAAPDTLVISAATRRLVRGIFVLEDLGAHDLKGIAAPVATYRVVQPSGVRSRLDLAEGALTRFVGRDVELGVLLDRWERVQEREGQAVLVSGEAGVGKSRLVYELREQLAERQHTWLECRCSPYTQGTAFSPLIALLEQGLALAPTDGPAERMTKIERGLSLAGLPLPETAPLVAAFLSIPVGDAYVPLPMSAELQRRRTLEALTAWALALGEIQPVLVLVEDLHWCDPSSLELFGRLIEQSPTARVMFVCTARPDFVAPWKASSKITPLQLSRLTRRQAREMAGALCPGRALPEPVLDVIVERADGIPLYVEELTRMVLESGLLVEHDGCYQLTRPLVQLAIPSTLQDSLMARLDRLSAAKEVAQRAAVLGRDFSYPLLEACAGLDAPVLHQGLSRLVEAELLFQRGEPPDATYTFKHALVQETAYQSLLKGTRAQYHARVAQVLEDRFPDRARSEPELLARHWEESGRLPRAIDYHRLAGERAAERSAHPEAISHLSRGLTLVAALPQGPERDRQELLLQVALGARLLEARGYGEAGVERAYERARELCQRVADAPQLFQALWGLNVFYQARNKLDPALELGEQLLALARRSDDPSHLIEAHLAVGCPQYWRGEFTTALAHVEQTMTLYDPARHAPLARVYGEDPGVSSRVYGAQALWVLGFPDRALARIDEAIERGRQDGHPFSLAYALDFAAAIHCLRGEIGAARTRADEAIALCEQQNLPLWLALARALRAWTIARSDAERGIREFREALGELAATATEVGAPFLLSLLVETHHAAGRGEEARPFLETALALSHRRRSHFWLAELHRLEGELALERTPAATEPATTLFRRALEVARAQEARGLELRAATSLARVLQRDAGPAAARAVLAPVYERFGEGFDTVDLRAARTLLEAFA